jgi:hypothetical protein
MSRITPAIDTRLFNALQPSVSVGKLTADLMISSLSAVRVGKHDWHARVEGGRSVTVGLSVSGYLRTKAVLPVVGMGAFDDGVLSTALEGKLSTIS